MRMRSGKTLVIACTPFGKVTFLPSTTPQILFGSRLGISVEEIKFFVVIPYADEF